MCNYIVSELVGLGYNSERASEHANEVKLFQVTESCVLRLPAFFCHAGESLRLQPGAAARLPVTRTVFLSLQLS
jgi:hypothetical protein